jgi:hypothetical protein
MAGVNSWLFMKGRGCSVSPETDWGYKIGGRGWIAREWHAWHGLILIMLWLRRRRR